MKKLQQLGSLCSRTFNVIFLGGLASQTTSARCYIDPDLKLLKKLLDTLDKDHCKTSWEREVNKAINTIHLDNKL